jgi:tetratricopeptide (TPR) repeat protein
METLRYATRLAPGNAEVHIALGIQMDLAGLDPQPEFGEAARLAPFLAEPWLRLGLLAESRGDLPSAERLLLHAAAIDHKQLPRFTLMNFYFRRGDAVRFWHWARLACERAYGDPAPMFDLCWRMAAEPAEVYEKAIPRDHAILRAYTAYLVSRGRIASAAQPARDLLAQASAEDRDLVLDYCDRLVDISPAEALWVWNAACSRGLFPYGPAGHPVDLVNPAFAADPLQKAFDWKLVDAVQVPTARVPSGGMEFSFNGRQPEAIELMTQTIPVPAGRNWRLAVEYQTERVANPTGFLMTIEDRPTRHLLANGPLPPSESGVRQSLVFASPASGLVTLRFRYQRPLGSVRTEGTLTVRTVHLTEAP